MKKLLVLALVLSVVGLANAGILIPDRLEYTVDQDAKTVTLTLLESASAIEIGVMTPDAGILTPGAMSLFANGGAGTNDPEGMGLTMYTFGTIVGMSGNTGSAVGVVGDFYTFSYEGTNLVTISSEVEWGLGGASVNFVAGDVASIEGAQIIIPEPMTMVLLGLGGLFLRRK